MEPADFYTGMVAELYGQLKSTTNEPEPYAIFIRHSGQPALELGCGDGEPILALRRAGFDVEGVDSSADMIRRCRRLAAHQHISVVLYQQKMQELDLPRRYRSIFLAGPTFNLLPDDDTAVLALQRICTHLETGGTALVPLFEPDPTPPDELGRARQARAPDGATISVSIESEEYDRLARTRRSLLRYERASGAATTVLERPWLLHWYTQARFRELATMAGLTTVEVTDEFGQPAPTSATDVTFVLTSTP